MSTPRAIVGKMQIYIIGGSNVTIGLPQTVISLLEKRRELHCGWLLIIRVPNKVLYCSHHDITHIRM